MADLIYLSTATGFFLISYSMIELFDLLLMDP